MIHLWNTKLLAKEFRNNELSQRMRFKYFLIFIVVPMLIGDISFTPIQIPWSVDSMPAVILSIMFLLIIVGGMILTYKANKAGDNKEFIDRYVCLSIPIFIKLTVLFIGINIVSGIIGGFVLDEYLIEYIEIFAWLIYLVFILLFFWRLISHIGWISKAKVSVDE